jgi:hypothetical protein
MAITPRNRYYTSPPDQHSQTFIRGWSDSATNTGIPGQTGLWTPIAVDPSGRLLVAIDNVSFSGDINVENNVSITGQTIPVNVTGVINSGSYSFNNAAITGSQTGIPAGSASWSLYVESGFAFVNGILYNTFETLAGGGYNGVRTLSSAINVGCTGTASAPSRVLLSWEG